jgi:hypothetical protein
VLILRKEESKDDFSKYPNLKSEGCIWVFDKSNLERCFDIPNGGCANEDNENNSCEFVDECTQLDEDKCEKYSFLECVKEGTTCKPKQFDNIVGGRIECEMYYGEDPEGENCRPWMCSDKEPKGCVGEDPEECEMYYGDVCFKNTDCIWMKIQKNTDCIM